MPPSKSDRMWDVAKILIATSLAVVVSSGGFWFAHGRLLVTRQETERMIATQSPYVTAKEMVENELSRMDDLFKEQNNLRQEVKENYREQSRALSEVKAEVAAVSAKIDVLLSRGIPPGDG